MATKSNLESPVAKSGDIRTLVSGRNRSSLSMVSNSSCHISLCMLPTMKYDGTWTSVPTGLFSLQCGPCLPSLSVGKTPCPLFFSPTKRILAFLMNVDVRDSLLPSGKHTSTWVSGMKSLAMGDPFVPKPWLRASRRRWRSKR